MLVVCIIFPITNFSLFFESKKFKNVKKFTWFQSFCLYFVAFLLHHFKFFCIFGTKLIRKFFWHIMLISQRISSTYRMIFFFLDFNKFFLFLLSQLLILFLGVFFLFIKSSNVNELQKEINSKVGKNRQQWWWHFFCKDVLHREIGIYIRILI